MDQRLVQQVSGWPVFGKKVQDLEHMVYLGARLAGQLQWVEIEGQKLNEHHVSYAA